MTREEAIKGLTSLVEVRRKYVGMQTMKDEIECLDMAIKALEQEPKWIPVSERLPENSGNYLITYCYLDKIETQEAVYVKDEEDKWYDTTDIEITLAVIAWMPLPEPYKAESEK